jgi:hypothetical protein
MTRDGAQPPPPRLNEIELNSSSRAFQSRQSFGEGGGGQTSPRHSQRIEIATIPAIAEKVAHAEERQREHVLTMNKLKQHKQQQNKQQHRQHRGGSSGSGGGSGSGAAGSVRETTTGGRPVSVLGLDEEANSIKLEEDFSDIYAFRSPTLYFRYDLSRDLTHSLSTLLGQWRLE